MKCNRCLLSDDIPGITISKSGQCSFCDLHDSIEEQSSKINVQDVIKEIKKKGKGRKYDVIVGISGGFDSSFLLQLMKNFGLRTLALHFDNGWNGKEAEDNMKIMVEKTGADLIRISINNEQLNYLNLAFLKAGVSDADIPNDMAMAKIMYDVADRFDVKTIINGHNYRYEGSAPLSWSYMDAKYIQSVAKEYGVNISSYPILTFWDQIKYMLKGIKSVRILYYVPHNKEDMKHQLEETYGWKDYGGNHAENIYTEFVGGYLLPKKFGINKKLIYRSAELRSGIISRQEAEAGIIGSSFDPKKLKMIEKKLGVTIDTIMSYPVTSRDRFESYHGDFKKWKWLIYIGVKLGYFPMTFYMKYCK
jgi:N-acetyl sugar amidotransferase